MNAVRSALRSKHDLMLENLALRQQLAVLTGQRARTQTKPADRRFWSWRSRYWPGWRSTLVMVQPETVIRWHRTAWRGYWTWKSRARHPGRPRISKELQGLIAGSQPRTRAGAPPASRASDSRLPVHGFLGHLIGAGCPCGGGIHDRLSGGNERA